MIFLPTFFCFEPLYVHGPRLCSKELILIWMNNFNMWVPASFESVIENVVIDVGTYTCRVSTYMISKVPEATPARKLSRSVFIYVSIDRYYGWNDTDTQTICGVRCMYMIYRIHNHLPTNIQISNKYWQAKEKFQLIKFGAEILFISTIIYNKDATFYHIMIRGTRFTSKKLNQFLLIQLMWYKVKII